VNVNVFGWDRKRTIDENSHCTNVGHVSFSGVQNGGRKDE
jgi:hypothetical protein